MKLKKLVPYFIVLIVVILSLAFYFTRASIAFVYNPLISDEYIKNLSKPSRLSLKYRTSYKKEGDEIKKADLVVVLPPAATDSENAIYINRGEGRKFIFDEFSLFEKALVGKSYGGIAILYNTQDENEVELANKLKDKYENLELISYEERISIVNLDSINEDVDKLGIREILIPSASNAIAFIENTKLKIYMNFIDAAAFSKSKKIISIHPDWNKAISDALSTDGDVSFSFAFSTT